MAGIGEVIKKSPLGVKVAGGAAALAGAASAPMAIMTNHPAWWVVLGGVVLLFVTLAIVKFFFAAKDKAKASAFSGLLSKSASGGAGSDPAARARNDDLRRKFLEGVGVFKAAGKDLYDLPWYLLVGPSGTGKTEMMRHSGIPTPPGLQDGLQGAGGTINMHWWLYNQSVVIDTAGRMFMEEREDAAITEWKLLLKMLREYRGNCPINGLLLVVSADSLLRDSNEKVEQVAGVVARQLDGIQRTLDVRFPVSVVVTKCDMILGFREFFETLNDANAQHQILGWVNPAALDDKFQPELVEEHMQTVRRTLLKRRMGLLQNPVHTGNMNDRRVDQVDELFELPDNLMRIAPRLRRYLEMIFSQGAWSPKPLFLRGIYFTSSMREHQPLDMTLSQALGVPVDSLPGREVVEKDRSYFIRDVYQNKVFPEKGLVTRASNVSASERRWRRIIAGVAAAGLLLVTGLTVLFYFDFKKSVGDRAAEWNQVAMVAGEAEYAKQLRYFDPDKFKEGDTDLSKLVPGRSELANKPKELESSSDFAKPKGVLQRSPGITDGIRVPLVFKLVDSGGLAKEQEAAQRAVVEESVILPLLDDARSRLTKGPEEGGRWGPEAARALAQFVRLRTLANGGTPADKSGRNKTGDAAEVLVDVPSLVEYVMPPEYVKSPGYKDDMDVVGPAVAKADASAASAEPSSRLSKAMKDKLGPDPIKVTLITTGIDGLAGYYKSLGTSPGSKLYQLQRLADGLTKFDEAERKIQSHPAWAADSAKAEFPTKPEAWEEFTKKVLPLFADLDTAKKDIDDAVGKMGSGADDLDKAVKDARGELNREVTEAFELLERQLPALPLAAKDGKTVAEASPYAEFRKEITGRRSPVEAAVKESVDKLDGSLRSVAGLMVRGKAGTSAAAVYAARYAAYKQAADAIRLASAKEGAGKAATVSGALSGFDGALEQSLREARVFLNWKADAGDGEVGKAIAASERGLLIADAWRRYGVIADAVTRWPATASDLQQAVETRAGVLGTDAAGRSWSTPVLLLTKAAAEAGASGQPAAVTPGFHPAAARERFADWAAVLAASDAKGGWDGKTVRVDGSGLRKASNFNAAGAATGEYAVKYAEHWKRRVDDAVPRFEAWSSVKGRLESATAAGINDDLKSLGKTVSAALAEAWSADAASTPNFARPLVQAGKDVGEAVGPLGSAAGSGPFEKDAEAMLAAWYDLSGLDTTKARRRLLDGAATGDYFKAAPARGGSRYWSEFARSALAALTAECSSEMRGARDELVKARGVPLMSGRDARSLSSAEMQSAWRSVQTLKSAVDAPAGGGVAAGVEPEVLKLLAELRGSNLFKSEGERAWFAQVRKLAEAVYEPAQNGAPASVLSMQIVSVQCASASAVWDGYAQVRVGGQGDDANVGVFFRTKVNAKEDRTGEFNKAVRVPTAKGLSVWVQELDPQAKQGTGATATIDVDESWGFLKLVMTSDASQFNPERGTWNVVARSGDAALCLEVKLTSGRAGQFPSASEWPTAASWPRPGDDAKP